MREAPPARHLDAAADAGDAAEEACADGRAADVGDAPAADPEEEHDDGDNAARWHTEGPKRSADDGADHRQEGPERHGLSHAPPDVDVDVHGLCEATPVPLHDPSVARAMRAGRRVMSKLHRFFFDEDDEDDEEDDEDDEDEDDDEDDDDDDDEREIDRLLESLYERRQRRAPRIARTRGRASAGPL